MTDKAFNTRLLRILVNYSFPLRMAKNIKWTFYADILNISASFSLHRGWTEATKGSKVMGNKGWISEEKRAVKLGATNTEYLEHVMKKVKEN